MAEFFRRAFDRSALGPWLAATVIFGVLAALCGGRYYPPLPVPLTLDFILDPTLHGNQSDPIITTGVPGRGDFLYLHRADPGIIFIGYDSWNSDHAHSLRVALLAGTRHQLRIEMPGLDQVQGHFTERPSAPVRVWLDGELVLDQALHYYVRDTAAIYVGENPLGGTSAEPRFGGRLFDAGGAEIRGGAHQIFPLRARFRGWLRHEPGQVVTLLFFALVLASGGRALRSAHWRGWGRATVNLARGHRVFGATAAICLLVFGWFVTMGGFDFNYPESFCSFYDFQARSLLQGRLDVPEECLSGEAFVVDGKHYGYFGVTPALLRLPFAVFDLGLGRLSRWFMFLDYAAALCAAYLIFLTAHRLVRGSSLATGAPRGTAGFMLNVGLGSTLLFLGSRSYVYHEAILCGVMFALFSVWCVLRYWLAPGSRWWIGALICGLLSVHARPPTGLFVLALLALAAFARAWPDLRNRRPWAIGGLCLAAVLSFNALAYLKFQTFDGQPLRYNRNYDAERLAKFGEKKFHAGNIPYVAHAYLFGPSFSITRDFPWFHAQPKPDWRPVWTRMDMIEPTVGFPFAMPALFGAATIGGIFAWRRHRQIRGLLTVTVLSVAPMAVLLFAAIAVSHRYTADFCPCLIFLAAFGFVVGEDLTGATRRAARGALWLTTSWAILVTLALTLHHQREELWGVPEEVQQSYITLRQRVDAFFGTPHR